MFSRSFRLPTFLPDRHVMVQERQIRAPLSRFRRFLAFVMLVLKRFSSLSV
jgi:hypothetical protein